MELEQIKKEIENNFKNYKCKIELSKKNVKYISLLCNTKALRLKRLVIFNYNSFTFLSEILRDDSPSFVRSSKGRVNAIKEAITKKSNIEIHYHDPFIIK